MRLKWPRLGPFRHAKIRLTRSMSKSLKSLNSSVSRRLDGQRWARLRRLTSEVTNCRMMADRKSASVTLSSTTIHSQCRLKFRMRKLVEKVDSPSDLLCLINGTGQSLALKWPMKISHRRTGTQFMFRVPKRVSNVLLKLPA